MKTRIAPPLACSALFILAACAAPQPAPGTYANDGIRSFTFVPRYRSADGTFIQDQKEAGLPDTQIFDFRAYSGTFWGTRAYVSTAREVQAFRTGRDDFRVDVDDWLGVLHAEADPLKGAIADQAVKVTPADTRMSRVTTIVYAPGNGRLGGRFLGDYSQFIDADGWPVVLVYVDRACRIEGTMYRTGVEADFGGPGLYALVLRHDTRGNHKLVVGAPPETLDLLIQF